MVGKTRKKLRNEGDGRAVEAHLQLYQTHMISISSY